MGRMGTLKHKGLLVLRLNEKTQSNGEFYTLCLQTGDNEIIIWRQISCADGNVTRFKTVKNSDTACSDIGIFIPSKRTLNELKLYIYI